MRCHGATAIAGGVNPDLRDSVRKLGDAFVPIIAEGLPGTTMFDWGSVLDEREIRAVYTHTCRLMLDRLEEDVR